MNRKGFTLMELLLVVAVLAIVAAAAAPTFFGGAQDAMNEAKKASYMSAYQNAISGANMLTAIAASKGVLPSAAGLLSLTIDGDAKTIANYAPLAARTFKNRAGNKTYVFGASVIQDGTSGYKVVAFYSEGATEPTSVGTEIVDPNDATNGLEAKWKAINGDSTSN